MGYCESPVQWAGLRTTGIVAGRDRFVFDFSGGPSDEVISKVYYSEFAEEQS